MQVNRKVKDRESKLRALELKIRMRRFHKLKDELFRVKDYLLNDISLIEQSGEVLPEELLQIREELNRYQDVSSTVEV